MLDGIMSDGEINVEEMVHLATWLRERGDALDPTLTAFLELIDDIVCDGAIDKDEEATLQENLENLRRDLQGPTMFLEFEEGLIHHLIGVIKGVTSDQDVNESELARVLELLNSDVGRKSAFAKAIKSSIERCRYDKAQLVQTLCAIAGHDPSLGIVGGQAIGGIFDDPTDPKEIHFAGKSFAFTGTFEYGPRQSCARRVENLGGHFSKYLSDYLVVGSMVTRAWASTNYGRKIEVAIAARERGHPVKLISEAAWDKAARLYESIQ